MFGIVNHNTLKSYQRKKTISLTFIRFHLLTSTKTHEFMVHLRSLSVKIPFLNGLIQIWDEISLKFHATENLLYYFMFSR